jgi:DNA ligase-1
VYANTVKELMTFYEVMVERGWEGICWRHEHSLYKYGRSTLRQQGLVAHKKFVTSEAKILGYEEELKNLNAAERNELGYLKRSRKQENLVGKGRLGAFIMVTEDGATFKVGSGYSEAQRQVFWERREEMVGMTMTYRHQPCGAKEAPRIPTFVGIRDPVDMG